MTDYQKAKEASQLNKGKEVSFQFDNVRTFRKYLNDFAKIERKQFSTRSAGDVITIYRIK